MLSDSWVEAPSLSRLLFVLRCRSFVRSRNFRRCCCCSRLPRRYLNYCCCCSRCMWRWCRKSDQPRTWPWARSCSRTGSEDAPEMPEFEASTRCSPPRFRDLRSSRSTMKRSHCATASFHPIFNHPFFLKTIETFRICFSFTKRCGILINLSSSASGSSVVFQAIFENVRKIRSAVKTYGMIGEKFCSCILLR